MIFSSFTYVFFLAVVTLLFWKVPTKYRVPLLLLASYVFYMSWSPPFGLIYGPLIFLDSLYFYWLSRAMLHWPQHKKRIMIFGITTELLILALFKYANFLTSSTEAILSLLHFPAKHHEFHIFLPLAISFTNFILISYLVDVYRGDEKPHKSFISFASYVAFFPHLIAGPIVRASELLKQFEQNNRFKPEQFTQGIHKFIAGIALKIFIADMLAPYVNTIYGTPSLQGFNTSWIATYAFAIQILCDFSGYTLMAQGSALLMGYTLPENFNAPYFSKNISDFWRRWHMSLSRWLRDYLYIPLGGSRCSRLRSSINLFLTMGLGGLWHGANWTFVIWGLYQGLLLSSHKIFSYFKITRFLPGFIANLLTFHLVCIGWVFFRSQNIKTAFHMIALMFNPSQQIGISQDGKIAILIVLIFFIGHFAIRFFREHFSKYTNITCWIQALTYFFLLYLGVTMNTRSQEFIYFQF